MLFPTRHIWQMTGTERAKAIETAQANANSFRLPYVVFYATNGSVHIEASAGRRLPPDQIIATAYPKEPA